MIMKISDLLFHTSRGLFATLVAHDVEGGTKETVEQGA